MKNFNTTLTIEEATKLYKANGMEFVNTPHNREMMKTVVYNHLKSLSK